MNSMRAFILLLSLLMPASVLAAGMQALSEEDMDDVYGQQGIALNLEFRVNSKADGQAVDTAECPTVGALTGGASCRLAINLADLSGAWITLKNYRSIIKLTHVRIDASTFGAATAHAGNPYLTAAGYSTVNKPAIMVTAGAWATALAAGGTTYTNYLNSAIYNELTAALSLERLTAEFDSGSTPGYLRDAIGGAPISLRLAHGNSLVPDPSNPPDVMFGPYGNTPARARLDGRFQIHGFGF